MAFIIKDRVKENTTSTGTGAVTLGGAAATFDPFNSYMSNGDTTYYAIVHTASGTDEWEVGLGTWNTGNTLTRTTVLAGSNGTSAVNFSAGTKDVFMTYPASKAVYTDVSGDIDINGGTIDGTTIGANSHTTGKFTTLQATGNVDFDGYIDMAPIDHPTHAEGRVYYDTNHKSLSFQSDIDGVEHELGLEEHVRVYNNTGATLAKGKPVYWSGNQNDVPTVSLANATSSTKYNVQGLTANEIANNSYGYVIVSGLVYDIDTSGLNAGENFFAGLTDGALQNAPPSYPNYPMCLGWVIKSDSTTGIVLVNQQNHSVNSFRVQGDTHVGGDLTISGDLTVNGTQTATSSNNVSLGASFQYLNAGDTIGEANTSFTGSGLDDATLVGHFSGTASTTYYVRIDGTGTPDTFEWSKDNFSTTEATGVSITGNDQELDNGISVNFGATTGHTSGDVWSGTAAPANVDTGLFTNYNTGGSGVGYTHTGIFWDASTSKWTVLSEYDPEPEGTINLSDSSVEYATFKAGTFEGDLTGDVTGDVTGTATSANALATARTIGGVSFDGSANINLPGVNTTGNQDTSGNAATATALETARTIQLTGDVTGSATFDGSANASITATVQDDSHSHVISNVDGLQAALDGKTTTSRTITAGDGLTGGGNLTANRTLNVGAGSGITVTADAVAHADTSTQASVNNSGRTYIQDITLDGFGHVTGLTSATETVTDTTYTAGSGLDLSGTTFSHTDTSSQASVNNSGGTVIQDITLDTYGHITGINSTNLDGRYYTETEADSRFVNVTGDTMSGSLTMGTNWIYMQYSGSDLLRMNASGDRFDFYNQTQSRFTDVRARSFVRSDGSVSFHDGYHPNADKWTTARTLSLSGDASGSVSWDGSANATLSVTVANDSHTHDGRYYTETEADSRFLRKNTSDVHTFNTSTGEALKFANNTSGGQIQIGFQQNDTDGMHHRGYIRSRKSSAGNAAGIIEILPRQSGGGTGTAFTLEAGQHPKWGSNNVFHDGYHPNADKWTTARTLSLSGDASGSVSWDGSANANLSVTVANDSHTHTPSNISGLIEGTSFNGEYPVLFGIAQSPPRIFSESSITFRGSDSRLAIDGSTVWHAGNDGSGSGLDADLLDGIHASSFLRSDTTDSINTSLGFAQNPVGTTYGSGQSAVPPYMLYQTVGDNDGWRIYGEAPSSNDVKMIFEIVDDIETGDTWVFRNKRTYSPYNATEPFKIGGNGDCTASGNITAYSDVRLKDNINIIDNALDKVNAIRGVTYNRTDTEDKSRHAGVIAQEVEEVLPEVVKTEEDGTKTVAYGNMVGLLIEAIKEQQAQIDELKAKLEA